MDITPMARRRKRSRMAGGTLALAQPPWDRRTGAAPSTAPRRSASRPVGRRVAASKVRISLRAADIDVTTMRPPDRGRRTIRAALGQQHRCRRSGRALPPLRENAVADDADDDGDRDHGGQRR